MDRWCRSIVLTRRIFDNASVRGAYKLLRSYLLFVRPTATHEQVWGSDLDPLNFGLRRHIDDLQDTGGWRLLAQLKETHGQRESLYMIYTLHVNMISFADDNLISIVARSGGLTICWEKDSRLIPAHKSSPTESIQPLIWLAQTSPFGDWLLALGWGFSDCRPFQLPAFTRFGMILFTAVRLISSGRRIASASPLWSCQAAAVQSLCNWSVFSLNGPYRPVPAMGILYFQGFSLTSRALELVDLWTLRRIGLNSPIHLLK